MGFRLETAGEAEQAEATAALDAGPDAGLGGDLGTPGGAGAIGAEPELGVPTDTAADLDAGGGATPDTGEGDLLAAPPGKREDSKGRTTTARSHGWYEPRSMFAAGDRRKSSGPRKKNMNRAASPETGTRRTTLPGADDLRSLSRLTGIYEQNDTNYREEENKILKNQKELETLFESLKLRSKKNETEA